MPLTDRYGLPLSTGSGAAAQAYIDAVDNMFAAGENLVAGFEAALAIDPGFALAEIGRARALATYGRAAEARAAATNARLLAVGTTARERSHVEALALAVEGRSDAALAAIKDHLKDSPRDAMVLHPTTGVFGLIGFSGRLDREAELLALLDSVAPHYGDDWWFMAIHAFAECEAGRLADADARVNRALEAAPHNANAAHVRAHVDYELNRPHGGAQFLRGWLARFTHKALLRGHLAWHLALWELGAGNAEEAWRLYEAEFRPQLVGAGAPIPPLNVLSDISSWLWRAELRGEVARLEDWRLLATYITTRFPQAGNAFVDTHAAMPFLRAGDATGFTRLQGELSTLAAERPASMVALRIAEGLAAHAQGNWALAAARLGEARIEAARIGGSNAQRELVDRSMLHALRQAGLAEQAAALSAARPQIANGT
jgi:tetratricopeptide (TPR) repeat protein